MVCGIWNLPVSRGSALGLANHENYTQEVSSSTIACVGFAAAAFGQKPKIIVDQDARGPASTDMQSILMFAQSPDVDVLGVTLVTGDQWVKEETAHTLRALELAGRTDIPVVPGAENPLVNSKEESEIWESQYGALNFKGAWTAEKLSRAGRDSGVAGRHAHHKAAE